MRIRLGCNSCLSEAACSHRYRTAGLAPRTYCCYDFFLSLSVVVIVCAPLQNGNEFVSCGVRTNTHTLYTSIYTYTVLQFFFFYVSNAVSVPFSF